MINSTRKFILRNLTTKQLSFDAQYAGQIQPLGLVFINGIIDCNRALLILHFYLFVTVFFGMLVKFNHLD